MKKRSYFDLALMQKKGAGGVDKRIDALLGAVLLILFVVVLVPVIFGTDGLNSTGFANAPTWVKALMTLIVGIGLVMIIYRAVSK